VIPRTAHIVWPGGYLPTKGGARRVRPGYRGLWCEACEWTQHLPRRVWTADELEHLRRQHLLTAHLSELIAGAVVLDPDLVVL